MVGTVGNKGLNAHRYETGTSVPVSFFREQLSAFYFRQGQFSVVSRSLYFPKAAF